MSQKSTKTRVIIFLINRCELYANIHPFRIIYYSWIQQSTQTVYFRVEKHFVLLTIVQNYNLQLFRLSKAELSKTNKQFAKIRHWQA